MINTGRMVSQQLKMIFNGHLDFGSERSYNMALNHWVGRMENYFKNDIVFKTEQAFIEESYFLEAPKSSFLGTEKFWRGTISLLQEISQYAIAGEINGWCIDNGQLVEHVHIEPNTDKSIVVDYQQGRQLVKDGFDLDGANIVLSRVIAKYERHALAYERRGYINYKLKNYNDALHDFDKSISINANTADPHYGIGKVRMVKNEWELAAQSFDSAIKCSIAMQPIYWLSRMKKGECHFHAKQYAEAVRELKLFLARNFNEADPNFSRRRRAFLVLGKAYNALGQSKEAIDALDHALATKQGAELAPDADGLVQRAIAKKKVGRGCFSDDLQAAVQKGSLEAERLLAEWL